MHLLLQVLGGGFYLLNKIFFSRSERARLAGDEAARRKWRIAAWSTYLVGVAPWVIIFVGEHNWIAATLEAGGAPAMLLGLVATARGKDAKPPGWLNALTLACLPLGLAVSVWDLGSFSHLTQWLETGAVVGYLIGNNLLARERPSGYVWFVLMHLSCAWLVWIEQYPLLFAMQIVSLGFILDAYLIQRLAKRQTSSDPP